MEKQLFSLRCQNKSQQSPCGCQPCRQNSCVISTAASWAGLQVVLLHPCRSLDGILSKAHGTGLVMQGKQPGAGPLRHRGDRSGGRQFHARLLGMMDCHGGSCSLQAQRLQACPSCSCQVLQGPKWCPRTGSRSVQICWARIAAKHFARAEDESWHLASMDSLL